MSIDPKKFMEDLERSVRDKFTDAAVDQRKASSREWMAETAQLQSGFQDLVAKLAMGHIKHTTPAGADQIERMTAVAMTVHILKRIAVSLYIGSVGPKEASVEGMMIAAIAAFNSVAEDLPEMDDQKAKAAAERLAEALKGMKPAGSA